MLKIKEAKEELSKKSYQDVQMATAWTWASRACVSYENVVFAPREFKVTTWTVAVEYAHEAIEHASLVEESGFLEKVQKAMQPYFSKAVEDLEMVFEQKL